MTIRARDLNRVAFVLLLVLAGFGPAAAQAPLVHAVKAGDRAAVRALLDRRADVNATQADGTTALGSTRSFWPRPTRTTSWRRVLSIEEPIPTWRRKAASPRLTTSDEATEHA